MLGSPHILGRGTRPLPPKIMDYYNGRVFSRARVAARLGRGSPSPCPFRQKIRDRVHDRGTDVAQPSLSYLPPPAKHRGTATTPIPRPGCSQPVTRELAWVTPAAFPGQKGTGRLS